MPQRTPSALPPFYDDLAASYAEAWRLLEGAAGDRRAPIHTIAVATVGQGGLPRVRTVVLRSADAATRQLRFHTDRRSAKFTELSANPIVEAMAYDAGHKIQLRLPGHVTLHCGDAIAQAAWDGSQLQSQLCYRLAATPGAPTHDPIAASHLSPDDGFENFVAVIITVDAMEWLYLAALGHRRARFTWATDGQPLMTWCAV